MRTKKKGEKKKKQRKKERKKPTGVRKKGGQGCTKIYKLGKMLSKDYLRNKRSRLVQMSTQPNILSDSSQEQMCKETVCEQSQYKT